MTNRRCVVRGAMMVLAVTVVSGACAERGEDGEGVTLETPRFELTRTLQLGGPDAPAEEAFVREPRIALGPDGLLHVLDGATHSVRVFDDGGAYLRSIGGEGEGPGEFTFAADLGFAGDTLWIRNLTPPYAVLFDAEGRPVRRVEVESPEIGRTGVPEGPDAILSGGHVFQLGVVPWGSERGPAELPLTIRLPGGGVDTIGIALDPPSAYAEGVGSLGSVDPGTVPPL